MNKMARRKTIPQISTKPNTDTKTQKKHVFVFFGIVSFMIS